MKSHALTNELVVATAVATDSTTHLEGGNSQIIRADHNVASPIIVAIQAAIILPRHSCIIRALLPNKRNIIRIVGSGGTPRNHPNQTPSLIPTLVTYRVARPNQTSRTKQKLTDFMRT
jgi:hypothetical protein